MKKSKRDSNNRKAANDSSPANVLADGGKQTSQPEDPQKETDTKKHNSFREALGTIIGGVTFDRSVAAVIAFATVVGAVVYVYNAVQDRRRFSIDHRPKLIFSKPPEILGAIDCTITSQSLRLHAGLSRIWVKKYKVWKCFSRLHQRRLHARSGKQYRA